VPTPQRGWGDVVLLVPFACVLLGPLVLAADRLWAVGGANPMVAVADLSPAGWRSAWSSIQVAFLTSMGVVLFGVPLAFALADQPARRRRWMNTAVGLPFVTPSIVAAVAFLALMDLSGGLGSTLRSTSATSLLGPGSLVLILAMIWFNVSLMTRMLTPALARTDPAYLEQLRLLPQGKNRWRRLWVWWWPVLGPGVAAAAGLTFTFAFTSFAVVRWLAPEATTIELLLAEQGGGAGIPGYRTSLSRLVLGAAVVQGLALLVAALVVNAMQRRHGTGLHQTSTLQSDAHQPSWRSVLIAGLGVIAALLPLLAVLVASLRVRTTEGHRFGLDGWERALRGDAGGAGLLEALVTSGTTAMWTVAIALPVGWWCASAVLTAERLGHHHRARVLDLLAMAPLVVSSAMVGLGSLLGLLRFAPDLIASPVLLPMAHATLVLPVVVRVLLPAMRALPDDLEEQAATLGLGPWRRWSLVRWPMLRPAAVVAAGLALAFSLGEFGASWILVRSTGSTTLAVLVDAWLARPGFDATTRPAAMAVASVLGVLAAAVMLTVERWRDDRMGGGL
jgi:thiamine transport system permease protein